MRHLAQNPKANLVILGDFNEGKPVGSTEQSLAVVFQARPPMVDSFSLLGGRIVTHAGGKAYDRIIVSDAIPKGLIGLKLEDVTVVRHTHGKNRRLYSDHFPGIARFTVLAPGRQSMRVSLQAALKCPKVAAVAMPRNSRSAKRNILEKSSCLTGFRVLFAPGHGQVERFRSRTSGRPVSEEDQCMLILSKN